MDDLSKTATALPSAPKKKGGTGRWKSILLTLAVPVGLLAVLGFVFRDQLTRSIPVGTARVILLEQTGETTQPHRTEMQFQASGWVEPDAWPVNLAVKENGFVEQVFIKEGEAVTNGQMVATLDSTDARLALEEAKANVQKHEATRIAKVNAATAAQKQAEAAEYRVKAAVARLTGEKDIWDRFSKTAPDVISHTERVAAQQAVVEFEAEEKAARAALKALEAKTIQAKSEIKVAEAELATAEKRRDIAKLALDRTTIRSNMDGLVLRRYVQPGDKRMAGSDHPNSAAIAAIYDPTRLQVRVDVPIAEAGKMKIGQPTRIFTALFPGRTFSGRITRIIGQADLQRNTLQAKVAIDEPDERLRPDVLCRVEFWSDTSSGSTGPESSGGHALWIPEQALQGPSTEQTVWVVDPLSKTVQQRTIKLSSNHRDGFRMVTEGLRANEVVVLTEKDKLIEGARVKEVNQ